MKVIESLVPNLHNIFPFCMERLDGMCQLNPQGDRDAAGDMSKNNPSVRGRRLYSLGAAALRKTPALVPQTSVQLPAGVLHQPDYTTSVQPSGSCTRPAGLCNTSSIKSCSIKQSGKTRPSVGKLSRRLSFGGRGRPLKPA